VSGQRSPMLVKCDWRRCPSSQWCCPNDASGHKPAGPFTSPVTFDRGPILRIWRDGCALPQRLPRSRRRGALSHAEALATGETPSPGNRSTSRGLLYSRDLSGSPLLFSVRVAADQRCHRWMRRSVILGSRCRPPRQQCQSGSLPPVASRSGPVHALVH
jgi:hypothetical protein